MAADQTLKMVANQTLKVRNGCTSYEFQMPFIEASKVTPCDTSSGLGIRISHNKDVLIHNTDMPN